MPAPGASAGWNFVPGNYAGIANGRQHQKCLAGHFKAALSSIPPIPMR